MVAGRLRQSLVGRYGEDTVFRDKDSIAAGEDWMQAIRKGLTAEVVVLALIGHSWASAVDAQGRRRLDDPTDWNRIELEQAITTGRRIIPVLVDGAQMPSDSDLPESLRPVMRLNALKLRDDDWESDVEKLVHAVGLEAAARLARYRLAVAVVGAFVLVVGGAAYLWWGPTSEDIPTAPGVESKGGSYRADIVARLRDEQYKALALLDTARPQAIRLIDDNLGAIDEALKSFPEEPDLHVLAGYAAKNVFASSKGILSPERRALYLKRARHSFERALLLKPNDPGAVNGMGNVLFYEGRFDEAIAHHKRALELTGGNYPAAKHDLDLVAKVQSGKIAFNP
jgi:tetratricopeptide (TPR) repeat protein